MVEKDKPRAREEWNETTKILRDHYYNKLNHHLKNSSMNRINILGFVGRDSECQDLSNGSRLGTFSICTEERYKDKNGEWQSLKDWHVVKTFNRSLVDSKVMAIRRGHRVLVEGKLRSVSYKDKDGNDKRDIYVEAFTIEQIVNVQ
jgi:single-strand DNA-binding protein